MLLLSSNPLVSIEDSGQEGRTVSGTVFLISRGWTHRQKIRRRPRGRSRTIPADCESPGSDSSEKVT